ncbi:myoneurin-like, partial [Musca vetustissima]|uniref:myoneurin-like n=1 Tax=Musca vetustissima TaxID=27455 RepID=UPI002AB7E4C9
MNFLFNINVCRVCMQNEKGSDLLNCEDLLEKFTYTTRLTVTDKDNLPKIICSKCIARLKVAHSFIKTAHESENNLKTFLAKINNEFQEVTKPNTKGNLSSNDYEDNIDDMLLEEDVLNNIQEHEDDDKTTSITKDDSKPKTSPKQKEISTEISHTKNVSNTKDSEKVEEIKDPKNPQPQTDENKPSLTFNDEDENILIINSDNVATEYENDMQQMENDNDDMQDYGEAVADATSVSDENESASVEENLIMDLQEQITKNVKEAAPQSEINVEDIQHILEGHEEAELDEENGSPETDEIHDENIQHNETEEEQQEHFTLNEEEESQASSTEFHDLGLEETPDDDDQQHNNTVVIHNTEPDTEDYVPQYETLINNQVHELQYHDEQQYTEANVFEESTTKGNQEDPGQEINAANQNLYDNHFVKSTSSSKSTAGPKEKISLTIQQKVQRFYCQDCDRDFSTKTNLNRHMQSHKGNKPHVCPHCSKGFTQKSTLKQHIYTHTGERPYICDICDRGFTQCKSLIFHKRRHTGEKPFQCEYCLLMFRQKDALR